LRVAPEPGEFEIRSWMRVAGWGYFLLVSFLYGSAFAGFIFESRLAVLFVLVGLLTTLAVHLAVSILEYRRIMRREWPKVAPLVDDDDWDAA
jgi:hypothetical protein